VAARSWHLKRGETAVATLTLDEIDQPWFRCSFAADPHWDAVRPTVEEWTQSTLEINGPDPLRIPRAWQAVKDLGLTLVSLDGGPHIEDFFLHVDGAKARFRY
jgi:hypothetical protein